jgi:hypothetical protein
MAAGAGMIVGVLWIILLGTGGVAITVEAFLLQSSIRHSPSPMIACCGDRVNVNYISIGRETVSTACWATRDDEDALERPLSHDGNSSEPILQSSSSQSRQSSYEDDPVMNINYKAHILYRKQRRDKLVNEWGAHVLLGGGVGDEASASSTTTGSALLQNTYSSEHDNSYAHPAPPKMPQTIEDVASEAHRAISYTLYHKSKLDPKLVANAMSRLGPASYPPRVHKHNVGRLGIEIDTAECMLTTKGSGFSKDDAIVNERSGASSRDRALALFAINLGTQLCQSPWSVEQQLHREAMMASVRNDRSALADNPFLAEAAAPKQIKAKAVKSDVLRVMEEPQAQPRRRAGRPRKENSLPKAAVPTLVVHEIPIEPRPVALYFNTMEETLTALRLLNEMKRQHNSKSQSQQPQHHPHLDHIRIGCLGQDGIPQEMVHRPDDSEKGEGTESTFQRRQPLREGCVDPTKGLIVVVQPTERNKFPPVPRISNTRAQSSPTTMEMGERQRQAANKISRPIGRPRQGEDRHLRHPSSLESLQVLASQASMCQIPVVIVTPRLSYDRGVASSVGGLVSHPSHHPYGGMEPPRPTPWLLADFTPPVYVWVGNAATHMQQQQLYPSNGSTQHFQKTQHQHHGYNTRIALTHSVMDERHPWHVFTVDMQTETSNKSSSNALPVAVARQSSTSSSALFASTYVASTASEAGRPTRDILQALVSEYQQEDN